MDEGGGIIPVLLDWTPLAVVVVVGVAAIWLTLSLVERKARSLLRPAMLFAFTLAIIVGVILSAPVSNETRLQLIGLLGLALTAVIAISSTTFISNAMAGLMLKSLRNFGAGDFIKVEGEFGRVTERGLFHTEIQNEQRELTTIPNLLLAAKPTTVIRASGTIITAEVSIGYDAPRTAVEEALVRAAESAELEEPFTQILELGNFAVTYRSAGFLPEVKHLVSARSKLRAAVMDELHRSGIEIVSPRFINRRDIGEAPVIPTTKQRVVEDAEGEGKGPEEVMFDKAERAERLEALERELEETRERIEKGEASDEELESLKGKAERLDGLLKERRERFEAEREEEKGNAAGRGEAPEPEAGESGEKEPPEEVMFDKAERAERLENLETELEEARGQIEKGEGAEAELDELQARAEKLERILQERRERFDSGDDPEGSGGSDRGRA